MRDPFRYFNSSPEVIRLAVMMYIRFPLSLSQVEDIRSYGQPICSDNAGLRYTAQNLVRANRNPP